MLQSTKASFAAFASLALSTAANAYFLAGNSNFLTIERIDPIVNPGTVSGHSHIVFGGSNFADTFSTDKSVQSQCTTMPIVEDKSNYWAPALYFQWKNGSFSSLTGGAVIYYLYNDKPGTTTPFPPNFRMLSGNPTKRTYDANSFAQKAIDFLCLDFNGVTTKHTGLPNQNCPSGIRSQVNFPSCWDGKNTDSADHKSHVAFRSGGPDSGDCKDPNFPVNIPRIFMEIYWDTGSFSNVRDQAMNPDQPFVFSYGDRTGYGNHADFTNGWQPGVLQKVVDSCTCNIYGDPQCCADKGIFTIQKDHHCAITKLWDEPTTGTLAKLPGDNPVQEAGKDAVMVKNAAVPARLSPVYAYTGNSPTKTGTIAVPAQTGAPASSIPASSSSAPASTQSSSSPVSTPASTTKSATSSQASSPAVSTPVSTSKSSTPAPSSSTSKPVVTPTSSSSSKPGSSSATPKPSSSSQVHSTTQPSHTFSRPPYHHSPGASAAPTTSTTVKSSSVPDKTVTGTGALPTVTIIKYREGTCSTTGKRDLHHRRHNAHQMNKRNDF